MFFRRTLGEHGDVSLQPVGVVGEDYVFLGLEVVEEGPRRDVRGGGDVADRGLFEAVNLEKTQRRAFDTAAGVELLTRAETFDGHLPSLRLVAVRA